MSSMWYKDWFNNPAYLALYKHRDDNDAKKIISLLFRNISPVKGGKCLDLACGNGRHSILFARKGYNVTGLDLSPYLIEQAKKRLKNQYKSFKDNLRFVIKDMRNIGYVNEFDLAVNLFSSFGYFEKRNENFKVIKEVSVSLKKGGFFLFDFLNKEYLAKNVIPFDIKKLNDTAFLQIRHITGSSIVKNIIILKNSKSHKTPEIHQFLEKIQLYSLNEFKKEFSKHGLRIQNVFGNYRGDTYNKTGSERLIILAQKN
jgi:SAM-dependent methyltransferase